MNGSIIRSLAMFGICAAGGAAVAFGQHVAMNQPVRVTIPFEFTVGSKSFGAGEYTVRQIESRVFAIQSLDFKSSMLAHGHPADAIVPSRGGGAVLTFHRYGDRYFLSQVSEESIGWEFGPSPAERELIAKYAPEKPITIATSRAR
jgi:hypothetical protein